MTQTAKLDITKAEERGLTMGLNEFSGYVGVAIAGILTAYAAAWLGARSGLLVFGMAVVILALVLTVVWVKDTLPWAKAETAAHKAAAPKYLPRYPQGVSEYPTTGEVFALMSWRDRRLFAISQAGLVEKFVDALVWALFPVFLVTRGTSLTEVGWIVGSYGCLGRLSALHRTAIRPCGPVLAQCVGHVDLRRGRGDGGHGHRCALVVRFGGRDGLRHGATLPEPFGGRGRYHSALLARLGHRDLPLLA